MNEQNNTIYCIECGKPYNNSHNFCPACGKINPNHPIPNSTEPISETFHNAQNGNANMWIIALLLSFFLGGIAAHRFYVGKTKSAIYLITTCILSIFIMFISMLISSSNLLVLGIIIFFIYYLWCVIDFFCILIGQFKDNKGNRITPSGLVPPHFQ